MLKKKKIAIKRLGIEIVLKRLSKSCQKLADKYKNAILCAIF